MAKLRRAQTLRPLSKLGHTAFTANAVVQSLTENDFFARFVPLGMPAAGAHNESIVAEDLRHSALLVLEDESERNLHGTIVLHVRSQLGAASPTGEAIKC